MRVRTIRNSFVDCPPHIAMSNSPHAQALLTIGKEYDVHAMALFEGVLILQVIYDQSDIEFPCWYPAWFFVTIDPTLDPDWICNTFDDEPAMVIGPEFIAANVLSYNAMAELELEMRRKFRYRLESKRMITDE